MSRLKEIHRGHIQMAPDLADPALKKAAAYVDGAWLAAGESGTYTLRNPATGGTLAELPLLSRAQVARAVDAAHALSLIHI